MPSTFQALAVALLALLPGALYELAREQRSGRWGLRGADQIFRMLGFSVAFQVLISPLTYWLYSHYVVTGHLARGERVSGWVWVLLIAYLVTPFAIGRFTAWGHKLRDDAVGAAPLTSLTRRGRVVERVKRWLNAWNEEKSSYNRTTIKQIAVRSINLYTDIAPAPRAWDYFWSRPNLKGWVVLHLNNDALIGAVWNESYASGYPESGDLYLSDQLELDPINGAFVMQTTDTAGNPIPVNEQLPKSLGKNLLIRWDEIKYLDFYPA
ncbi:hypothetical protein HND25_10350 [Rhodococcus erythropolis]|uniref:DUF6338 family protein n=1 Tax=Rhodococcus erythropolis TaxID=1833 RepID=UPI000F8C889F|nr:DUF6338 family protein [Rhodococcus erythropolis]MBO8147752.1 hypothetical protein [Rhodococcus erythropolis]MDO1489016.1 hypothetical protein [Rhodococcus erythropolis]